MADQRVYDSSEITVLLERENISRSSEVLESLWMPNASPSFQGSKSMVNFEKASEFEVGNNDEDFDGFWRQPGKKRRLSVGQVQFLEKNFNLENKLEPDRKIQLAKELGLQPRQVAIWFQNRRARYKTKQLEKDYSSLRTVYDKLKSEYDNLIKDKEKLKVEVNTLNKKLLMREKRVQNLAPIGTINSSITEVEKSNSKSSSEKASNLPMVVCKQEEASSTKSVVFDSDSPQINENHSSMAEPADSSHAFEPDHSDFSQDEEDNLSRNLLPTSFPKLEDCYYDDPPSSCCNFGFQMEDQPLGFWPY